jgi:AAA15 family ATPase/GTPase
MLKALEEMDDNPFRQILLASIWNANINGLDHLDTFVRIAIEGNYFEALECLTVIEESEGELNEEKILDSLLLLKAYMADEKAKDEAKFFIIEDIMQKVSDLNLGIR